MIRVLSLLGLLCSAPVYAACPEGAQLFTETRLFMGRGNNGTSMVSEAEWRQFVKSDIIPRFPAGFTVLDAAGYWKSCNRFDANGECEKSKVLLVQYEKTAETETKITEIMDAYIIQFKQQAVMRSDTKSCTWFYTGKEPVGQ